MSGAIGFVVAAVLRGAAAIVNPYLLVAAALGTGATILAAAPWGLRIIRGASRAEPSAEEARLEGRLAEGRKLLRDLSLAGWDNVTLLKQAAYQWIVDAHDDLVGQDAKAAAYFVAVDHVDGAGRHVEILSADGRDMFMADHRDGSARRLQSHLDRLHEVLERARPS